jgi:aminopeptidase YwaD
MMFCAETAGEEIASELVYVNTGREEDYAGKSAEGKIVVFDRDPQIATDAFYNEICTASRMGAVGAIMVNFQEWAFIGTLESGFFEKEKRLLPVEPDPLPALCISRQDGDDLKKMLEAGPVTVGLSIAAKRGKMKMNNVRGIIPGAKEPEKRIIVCGHLDTEGVVGSNDNTSGLAIMLELARILKENPCEKTIELLAVECEEISSMGSWHYCRQHEDDLKDIVCVLNIDMVAVGGDLCIITEGNWPDRDIPTPEWLYTAVKNAADELNYKIVYDTCPLGTSDEGRFNTAGVPAVFFWKPSDEHYHSMKDTQEYIDPNNLKVVAEIAMLSAMRISGGR